MLTSRVRALGGVLFAALAIAVGAINLVATQAQAPSPFTGLAYRGIGPTNQGGRFVDYAVVEATPQVFYAATASGGLWKTENHGLTWTSIFDNQPAVSIGAVALFQPNPSIVWVGTGEANNSRSSYWGDGVYKSTDAGKTWTNVGLKDSHHIGRIVTHPADPNIVYVAALGHLYSNNEERGVYKTIDGGKSWSRVLDVTSEGKKIGVVDVTIDPKNPNVLFAAAYDKTREPWTFVEGGPGSALYRSADAGKTWTKLAGGLPGGMIGRIGVAISRQDSNRIYATVENVNAQGVSDADRRKALLEGRETPNQRSIGNQIYRSDDGGKTWQNVTGPGGAAGVPGEGPPYYYAQVRVDPNDKNHVYVLGVGVHHSTEGGGTWSRPFNFGGDNHALWINPRDSKHMILGYDHGMGVTFDAGRTWYHPDDMPLAQFYAVGADMSMPYNVAGGLQDNGSWMGPSSKKGGRPINFEDWFSVGGGDGMYNVFADNRWLFNTSQFAGGFQRLDLLTGQRTPLGYRGPDANTLRYNWNPPLQVSPHDSSVLWVGASKLLRSTSRGDNLVAVSPDLTVNAEKTRNGRGNIQFATITTIDESPIAPCLMWVGTDDGNVQMSMNACPAQGQAQWVNVTKNIPNHPGYWVSRVAASSHDPAVAYVSVTGYRNDDFKPFVWKTSDYGKTWTSIAANLPNEPINVIREDRRNPNLLIVGTEPGIHASLDGGRSWHSIQGNMPRQFVYDLLIHPRDNELVVATHGRGIFIADISHLQQMTSTSASQAQLFEPTPAVLWQSLGLTRASSSQNFDGPSRRPGLQIQYWLPSATTEDVRVRIYEGTRLVRDLPGTKSAGLNTVVWDLSRIGRERTEEEKAAMRQQQAGRGGRGGQPQNADFVMAPGAAGTYRVVLSVGGRTQEKAAVVMPDPSVR